MKIRIPGDTCRRPCLSPQQNGQRPNRFRYCSSEIPFCRPTELHGGPFMSVTMETFWVGVEGWGGRGGGEGGLSPPPTTSSSSDKSARFLFCKAISAQSAIKKTFCAPLSSSDSASGLSIAERVKRNRQPHGSSDVWLYSLTAQRDADFGKIYVFLNCST